MLTGKNGTDNAISGISIFFLVVAVLIIAKLFDLQVLQHDYYATFALSSHEIYRKLHPARGEIYFQDSRTKEEYPAAVNRLYYLIYAVPKEIKPAETASTSQAVARILGLDETQAKLVAEKLGKAGDVYEPIARKIDEEKADEIKKEKLPGLYSVAEEYRYYPENFLGANVLGFSGLDDDGNLIGHYGVEGYWNKLLSGKSGFLLGEKGALGNWISLAGRTSVDAENGAGILLTIDRTLQYRACELLRAGMKEYGARSAALVMMDPKTGAVLAMCSLPDFDPNNYSKAENISAYNNTAVFTPYEPGSVFKTITMSGALDLGLVNPDTSFADPCQRRIDNFTIHNALDKCYGTITMTGVLENSVNTGMIWVEEKMGSERLREYVQKFGFGEKTGVGLDTEIGGNISSLDKKGAIHGATASFGQGITVTPLQIAAAYSAVANRGQLMKPYVVEEVRYPDGRREKTTPQVVGAVVSPRVAKLITGMLVSVVENGHSRPARLEHYYLAGKTGTAQIAGLGGYTEETNHTFAGYGPADDPRFVIVAKYEAPQRAWAESTVAPLFKELMGFAFQYYGLPEER